jgi:hypothetical protein
MSDFGAERLAQWVAEHRVGGVCGEPSAPWDGAPPDNRQQAYLTAALRNEAARVATSVSGERNNNLFTAARRCGQLIAGAGLDEQVVIDALEAAAEECGLTGEEGISATEATLRSGLDAGMANPRAVPPREGDNVVQMFSEASRDGEAEDTGAGGEQADLFDSDPIPLTASHPIPPFPTGALPAAIKDMVDAIAVFTQTDPAMAGTSALSVLSACNGGRARITLRPGWDEPLNAYYATIAHSGERKSAVQKDMTKPLYEAERNLAEASREARWNAEETKKIAEQAAEKQRRKAASAANTPQAAEERATALNLAAAAEDIQVPPAPRLVADDITPEALGSLLAEQGGRMAIISAEGGVLDIIAGRYNNNVPNMDVWLKGHSGDPVKVDRKGRPPEFVESPAVTLGLMIQPAVLDALAARQDFRGRGLLARVLYAYPVSSVGCRDSEPPKLDKEVVKRYAQLVAKLAEGMADWTDPARLSVTPEAERAVIELLKELEPALGSEGELAHLADWGSKYVGAVGRIAGNLHLAAGGPEEALEKRIRTPVEDTTIQAAARIGEYFKACAIRAFAEMGADPVTSDAIYLLGRIERLFADSSDEVSERDLFAASSRSRFKTMARLRQAIDRLIEHRYLAKVSAGKQSDPSGGRPASPKYMVHPLAAETAKPTKG